MRLNKELKQDYKFFTLVGNVDCNALSNATVVIHCYKQTQCYER